MPPPEGPRRSKGSETPESSKARMCLDPSPTDQDPRHVAEISGQVGRDPELEPPAPRRARHGGGGGHSD
eukprot:3885138-Pyramimonas_sp.AAC.1